MCPAQFPSFQVPNRETFQLTLRTIRMWARKHGIYSNVLGYLGGAHLALLVARVCQLYPNAGPSTLVQKFFLVFSNWQWPQPVMLKKSEKADLGLKEWDPQKNTVDRFHVMPIITPAYPSQNLAWNVYSSTLKVMQQEFLSSLIACSEITRNKATWDKLFATPSFFARYRHFLVLEVSSENEEDQLKWCGLVESKIRQFILSLEQESFKSVHIWPKPLQSQVKGQEKLCCYWFIGLVINSPRGQPDNINYATPFKRFGEVVIQLAIRFKIFRTGMKLGATLTTGKEVNRYLPPEEQPKCRPKRKRGKRNKKTVHTTLVSATAVQAHYSQEEGISERCPAVVIKLIPC